jgi:hypothetical protein
MPDFPFELYDPSNNFEMDLFNEVDQEKINIQGAGFLIWRFNLSATRETDDSIPEDGIDLNTLYGEALPKSMVFEGPYGPLKGSYLEPTWTQDLMQFGIVEPEEINIKFNKDQVIKIIGRPFIRGDIIKTFHLKHYIVEDTYVSEETPLWAYIHINVIARKVDDSQLTLPAA